MKVDVDLQDGRLHLPIKISNDPISYGLHLDPIFLSFDKETKTRPEWHYNNIATIECDNPFQMLLIDPQIGRILLESRDGKNYSEGELSHGQKQCVQPHQLVCKKIKAKKNADSFVVYYPDKRVLSFRYLGCYKHILEYLEMPDKKCFHYQSYMGQLQKIHCMHHKGSSTKSFIYSSNLNHKKKSAHGNLFLQGARTLSFSFGSSKAELPRKDIFEAKPMLLETLATSFGAFQMKYFRDRVSTGFKLISLKRTDSAPFKVVYYKGSTSSLLNAANYLKFHISEKVAQINWSNQKCHNFEYEKLDSGTVTTLNGPCSKREMHYFNEDKQLERVRIFIDEDKFYEVHYSYEKRDNLSLLVEKSYFNEFNEKRLSFGYEYNDALLLGAETLVGNISGNENAIECKKISYFYDDNERLSKLVDYKGLTTSYTYLEDSNLIEGIFYSNADGVIFKRLFYRYNTDFQKITEIQDDGKSGACEDLWGVSYRSINNITPHPKPSYVNCPLKIEYGFYDFTKGGFQLIKTQEFVYKTFAGPILIKTFAHDGVFLFQKSFSYNGMGKKTSMTDEKGKKFSYSYDKVQRLIQQVDHTHGVSTNYQYDQFGQLIHKSVQYPDNENKCESFTYDDAGRIISKVDNYSVTSEFTYDRFNRKISEILSYDGQTLKTDRQFDLQGNIVFETEGEKNPVQVFYTILNKPFLKIYSDGSKEHYRYNLDGQIISHTDRSGIRIDYEYDISSRAIKEVSYDTNGEPFLIKRFEYNSCNLIKEECGSSIKTYSYDSANRLVCMSENDLCTKYYYNDNNQQIAKQQSRIREEYIKDMYDRVVEKKVLDREKNVFRHFSFIYDSNDRIIQRAIHGKSKTVCEKFSFDSHGRLEKKVDNYGDVTRIYYKEKGLRKQICYPDKRVMHECFTPFKKHIYTTCLNENGQDIKKRGMFYDLKGNLLSELDFRISQKGVEVEKTCYTYDQEGRLIQVLGPYKNVAYQYFTDGKLKQIIKADGVCINFERNAKGVIARQFSTDNTIDYKLEYDDQMQLVRAIDQIHGLSVDRSFDENACLSSERYNNIELGFSYDSLKRVEKIKLPDKSFISYYYNPYFLKEVSRYDSSNIMVYRHIYDAFDTTGKLKKESLIGSLGQVFYDYDLLERLRIITSDFHHFETIELTDANQVKTMRSGPNYSYFNYDDLLQMRAINHKEMTFDSCYHRVDNLEKLEFDTCFRLTQNSVAQFTYDAKDRLIQAKTKSKLVKFGYDYFDRRLKKEVFDLNGNLEDVKNYFYWDLKEIGSVSNGQIEELRVLGIAKEGDIAAAVALEIKGKVYAPLHDLMGSIKTLVSLETKKVVEQHYYDEFANGSFCKSISPWLYCSKRADHELGLIFFSRRYFDPALGMFTTPDPKPMQGLNNPFVFSFNNPLSFYDAWGLENKAVTRWLEVNPTDMFFSNNSVGKALFMGFAENTGYFDLGDYTPSMQLSLAGSGNALNESKVFYINGILTSQQEATQVADKLSTHLNHQVICVYNTSRGIFLDCSNLILNKANIYEMPIVKGLRDEMLKAIHLGASKVYLFAHSEGGVIAKNALSSLRHEYRKKIDVFTFGSPSIIHNGYANKVVNYYSSRDAAIALSFVSLTLSNIFKDRYNIEYLSSSNEHLIDHYIMGSTYSNKLDHITSNISLNYGK